MPEETSPFDKILETDIVRLTEEIQRHREKPETKSITEQEILRRAIRSLPPAISSMPAIKEIPRQSPLPAYASSSSPETKLKIEYLMDLALHEGIIKAVSESKNSPDFVQDAFRDALAGRLYPELKKRGIVK